MNSILRSISLSTFMLAPALAGLLFERLGYVWTGAAIAAWNVASAIVELGLLRQIYRLAFL